MQSTPYFIGLMLPADIHHEIVQAQHDLFDERAVIRPIVPHITLLHPPAVERLQPEELAARIREIAAGILPLRLTLEGFGTFRQHSVHLRVQQQPQLMELHRKLVSLLPEESRQTHYPDGSTFTPHVTLAQAKRGRHLPPDLLGEYTALLEHLVPYTFQVEQITLFRWTAPREYTLEAI